MNARGGMVALFLVLLTVGLAGCGQSAAESRFLANVQQDAPGMSDSVLLQAGHDYCDHRDDADGGYSAINYIGNGVLQVDIGVSADRYLCGG